MANSSPPVLGELSPYPQMETILCPLAKAEDPSTVNLFHHTSLTDPYPVPNPNSTFCKLFANLLWGIPVKLSLSCAPLVIIISRTVQISEITFQTLLKYSQDRGLGVASSLPGAAAGESSVLGAKRSDCGA